MEEVILICRKCGHEEHGEATHRDEVKKRMLEHLEVVHALRKADYKLFVRTHYEDTAAIYK